MSNNPEVNTTLPNVEDLLCSICRGFLSCGPIRVLQDGSDVCGRCTLVGASFPSPTLEMMLRNTKFPCIYRASGCTAQILFGIAAEHEHVCEYRPLACISLPYTTCMWEGPAIQAMDHFALEHPSMVQRDATFELVVTENKEGILMVPKKNCAFVVKYLYEAASKSLRYTVGYSASNLEEDFCKIKLSHSLDSDYTTYTKGCECVRYNQNLFDLMHATTLHINKYLGGLNNPKTILIAIIMPKCQIQSKSVKRIKVDYDFHD